ncbi:MAG: LysR family transcriptional regulator [Acetobacteraceae bacterium]|nr:LysR family transcriptional regulator [Acetobacteraceae bacterium]
MIDAPGLAAFLTVVETGTVHAAAILLGLSQPALTRRLQRLEAALGVALFVRSGQRLRLSEAGQRLLPQAQAHLDGLNQALDALRDAARYGAASVTLGCLATLSVSVLPGILAEYAAARPQVRVRVLDLTAREIEQAVRDGTADFALAMLGVPEPGLTQEVLATEPMVLLAPARHPIAVEVSVDWAGLAGLPLISIGPQSANRRLLESVQASRGLALEWRHEVQRLSTAVALVAAGVGLTVVPQLAARTHAEPDIRTVRLTGPTVMRRLGVLRRAGTPLSAAADALRRLCARELRRLLPEDGSEGSEEGAGGEA